jgi:hypothetical protein
MVLTAWYFYDDQAYVLLSVPGVPHALKKYGRPKRELLPGERVEDLPWDDIDATPIIAHFCIGTAPDDQLEVMRRDLKEKAKSDKVVFLDGTTRGTCFKDGEEIEPV